MSQQQMTRLQKHVCKSKTKSVTTPNRYIYSFKSLEDVLSSDSWALSHIMPSIMRHYNPTKEYSKNATQIP